MFASKEFELSMTPVEKRAFLAIKGVCENFLGSHKADNYKEYVDEMLLAFKEMDIHISLKIHFFIYHLDKFPENMGDVSDEHGERFHKDIKNFEKAYRGKNIEHMLGSYCFSICRTNESAPLARKAKKAHQVFLSGPPSFIREGSLPAQQQPEQQAGPSSSKKSKQK